MNQFLFGRAVLPAQAVAHGPCKLFVLGAYPSALHVRWFCDGLSKPIRAVAVDNEPEPFWDGADEVERITEWKAAVSFREEWGRVEPCGYLNGPSGDWVSKKLLAPLSVVRSEAWITDCIDTYFESKGATNRLESDDVKQVLARLDIPSRQHDPHPAEDEIVRIAIEGHLSRLMSELAASRPVAIVTLGNAALRVLRELLDSSEALPRRLAADQSYGTAFDVTIDGRGVKWVPLAHPAAPKAYQVEHEKWVENSGRDALQSLGISLSGSTDRLCR